MRMGVSAAFCAAAGTSDHGGVPRVAISYRISPDAAEKNVIARSSRGGSRKTPRSLKSPCSFRAGGCLLRHRPFACVGVSVDEPFAGCCVLENGRVIELRKEKSGSSPEVDRGTPGGRLLAAVLVAHRIRRSMLRKNARKAAPAWRGFRALPQRARCGRDARSPVSRTVVRQLEHLGGNPERWLTQRLPRLAVRCRRPDASISRKSRLKSYVQK